MAILRDAYEELTLLYFFFISSHIIKANNSIRNQNPWADGDLGVARCSTGGWNTSPAPTLPDLLSQRQPSGCLLTQLPPPKLWGEDDQRVRRLHLQPREARQEKNWSVTPKTAILFSLPFVGSSPHLPVRQTPGETTPGCWGALHRTPSPSDAPGAAGGCFSLTLPYPRHLLPPPTPLAPPRTTPCPRGWGAAEAQKALSDSVAWPTASARRHLLSPTPEERAVLLLAASHPLAHLFRCRRRAAAEGTQGYTQQRTQPCKSASAEGHGVHCAAGPGLHCLLFHCQFRWHLVILLLEQ